MVEEKHERVALLIHGVGDAPSDKTQSELKIALDRRLPDSALKTVWYDWNEAIAGLVHSSDSIGRLGESCVTAARLEMDELSASAMGRLLRIVYRTVLFGLYVSIIWTAVAYAASALQESGPPSLRAALRWPELIFPALPNAVLVDSKWLATSVLQSAALTVSIMYPVFVLAIVMIGGHGGFRIALRRVILELFWPVIGVATMPSLLLSALAIFGVFLGLAFFISVFPAYQIVAPADPTTWWQLTETLRFGDSQWRELVFVIALLFTTGIIATALGVITRPLWKVLNDVLRYLGDEGFRQRIHRDLDDKLSELGDGEVIVIAHSLGSVIALDSLLSSPEHWAKFSRVRLVTCGSPLARLFHGWFPSIYGKPGQYVGLLRERYTNFDWLNIYRPFDYIGARLGPEGAGIRNVCTRQWLRFHTGYWTDRVVIEIAMAHLSDPETARERILVRPTITCAPLDQLARDAAPHDTEGSGSAVVLLLGIAAGFSCVVWSHFVLGPQHERKAHAVWTSLIAKDGASVVGRACPAVQIDTTTEFGAERRIVVLEYSTAGGQLLRSDAARRDHPHVDWATLHTHVYGAAPSGRWRDWLGLSDPPVGTDVDCRPVDVEYSTLHPTVFLLPAYRQLPPYDSMVERILTRVVRCLVMATAWMIWSVALFTFLMYLVPNAGQFVAMGHRGQR